MALLFGGMWIVNSYYWGNNQYIIQRALAAKDLPEAQRGVAFAAFMKLFIPFFAVLPGIAAWYLLRDQDPANLPITKADQAFPWVLANYVGVGFKGLTFAALVAAIGSSISSMVNSTSTIFHDGHLQQVHQSHGFAGLAGADGSDFGSRGAAGRCSRGPGAGQCGAGIPGDPGVHWLHQSGGTHRLCLRFLLPAGTAQAALVVVLSSVPLSWAFQQLMPDLPFLDRMAFIFLISAALMVIVSALTGKNEKQRVAERTLRGGYGEQEKRDPGRQADQRCETA